MEDDDLLYFSQHHAVAGEVTSSKHVLRVELMTVTPPGASPPDDVIFPQNATYPIHLHGFIASYHIRGESFPLRSYLVKLFLLSEALRH